MDILSYPFGYYSVCNESACGMDAAGIPDFSRTAQFESGCSVDCACKTQRAPVFILLCHHTPDDPA